jgi:hypothetical protein
VKLHRDEAEVDDLYRAAYLDYNGLPVMKCLTSASQTVWIFIVPSCDLEIMLKEEFENDQPIQVKTFVASIKRVQNFQTMSRRSGGEYITTEWKQAIGIYGGGS